MVDLSVIVPMYKGKKYIQKTVLEIAKIECSKEIIVIDDGSPDDSFEFAKDCFEKNDDIHVYKKANGGIADARNFGLAKATGVFILFVDQDDRINTVLVTSAVKKMKENIFSALMWSTMFEYESGLCKICDEVYSDQIANKDDIRENIIPAMLSRVKSEFTSYAGHIWGGLYRRDIIEKNKIRLKKFVDYEDDLLFVFDYLLHSESVAFTKDVGYYWLTNPQSYSHAFKYVENYIDKSEKFADYITSEYEKNVCHPIKKIIQLYFKQYTIVGALKNACWEGNKGNLEFKTIVDKVRQDAYRSAIFNSNNYLTDFRERFSLILIRLGLTKVALSLIRFYYFIR